MSKVWWVVLVGAAACGNKAISPQQILDKLAAAKQPTLVGPFKGIQLSETLVSKDVDGELCRQRATIAAWCELKSGSVTFRVERLPTDGKEGDFPVERLRITLPGAGVRDRLVAAWGPPTKNEDHEYWFAPSAHLRVGLHPAAMPGDPKDAVDLDFEGFWPLDEFLGPDTNLFGFEHGTPVLGARPSELRARYKARLDGSVISLWPIDSATKPTKIKLGATHDGFDDDDLTTPRSYIVQLTGTDEAVAAAMTRKFGKGQEASGATVYRATPRIAISGCCALEVGNVDVDDDDDDD